MEFGYILIYSIALFGIYSSVLFLLVFFDSKNLDRLSTTAPKKLPFVSVIIPAYNSERGVVRTLQHTLKTDYPKDKLEIIVVDDGSTDNTSAAASKFKKFGVKVFTIPHNGKASALNYGISKAKGEIVCNLDSDSFLDSDALMKMIGFFDNPVTMGVTPSVKIHDPKTIAQKVQMMEFLSSAMIRKVYSYLGSLPVASGACTLFRRKFFLEHGGYREDLLTEDGEVSMRLDSKGYSIECAMNVAVYTDGVPTFRRFFNQRLRWFRGLFDCLQIHHGLFNPRKGNIAVMILPLMMTSIALLVISGLYSLYKVSDFLWKQAVHLYLTGFDIRNMLDFKFDIFNVNLGATTMLLIIVFLSSILLLQFSRNYSREKQSIFTPYIYFLVTYGAFAFFCWFMAIYYKLAGRKIRWGDRYL